MFSAFDRIVIDVPKLPEALAAYSTLLGKLEIDDTFRLGNVWVTLRESNDPASRISSLGLIDTELSRGEEAPLATGNRNISLLRSHHRETAYSEELTDTGIYAIDHIVLQTRDADDCIRLFRDGLGVRLALDQEVPEWGGRMLFFRMGKMTLEVIQNLKEPPERDFFWGITYLCRDMDQTIAALDERDVAHSPIRPGRKPRTRVATVKSHCLGLPTLLVGPE